MCLFSGSLEFSSQLSIAFVPPEFTLGCIFLVYVPCSLFPKNVHSWYPHVFNMYSKHQVFTNNSPQTAVPSNTLARCWLLVFLSAWPAPLLHSWPGWWLHAFWSAQEGQHYCFVLIFFSERVTSQLSWIWSNSSASLRLLLTVPLSQVCPSFDLCLLILNIPPTGEAVSPNAEYVRLWKQKHGDSYPDS